MCIHNAISTITVRLRSKWIKNETYQSGRGSFFLFLFLCFSLDLSLISQVHNDDDNNVDDNNDDDDDNEDDNDIDHILFVQVEDPVQCDKYYVCETDGTLVPKLCEV